MEANEVSSREKLDQMLSDGKISREDYERLSEAMKKESYRSDEEILKPVTRRRLCKSRKHRLLGGVCVGFADYYEIDPLLVRIIAVVLALLAAPFVLTAYFVLYFLLPWDVEDHEPLVHAKPHPWWFALGLTFFLTILPWCCYHFILLRLADIFTQLGTPLSPIEIILIRIGDSYHYQYPSLRIPIGLVVSLLTVAFATLGYMLCRDKIIRGIYSILCLSLSFAWALFYIVAVIAIAYGNLIEIPPSMGS